MLVIDCPYCGEKRAEIEFSHAGEAHLVRPVSEGGARDRELEAFLFLRANPRGLAFERWYHVHGCGRYFNAVRDTVTERFILTYKAGLERPGEAELKAVLK